MNSADGTTTYVPAEDRYERMVYRRCGDSGLRLPAVSLGAWETSRSRSVSTRDSPGLAISIRSA